VFIGLLQFNNIFSLIATVQAVSVGI